MAAFLAWTKTVLGLVATAAAIVGWSVVFLQNTWNASNKISLETGLRFDHQNEYSSFFLPRIALLAKINPKLTLRLGGGLGYKTPKVIWS